MSALPHADPGGGVFETMLVIAGRPVELDAHLDRLETSVAALYGAAIPPETRAAALGRAAAIEHGKLRVALVPARDGDPPEGRAGTLGLGIEAAEVEAGAIFPGWKRAAALRGSVVGGGLGEHKWADRRLLGALEEAAAPGELPLLLDADGSVLEASRASVFAVLGERIVTPPTDGRILPSIARRQAIEAARAAGIELREERLRLDELRGAEAFLTGSVRGVEPVRAIDGAELAPPGELSERVAADLRRRWLTAPAAEPVAAAAAGRRAGPHGR